MRVLTLSLFAALLSAPAFAADLGTYRPGTPYQSIVAPGAGICDSQCAGDAQCRGWNYVKPNPRAPGICEFMSTVSSPIASQISISGVNGADTPYSSSRVTSGGTNTIRVGTQVSPKRNTASNTVTVGQTPSGRRIVRRAPEQLIVPQTASTKPIESMSLTEQQNRFRQGLAAPRQAVNLAPTQQPAVQAPRNAAPQGALRQSPAFRQHLDAPYPQQQQFQQPRFQDPRVQQQQFQQQHYQQPQFQQPQFQQPQVQNPQRQNARRATGPRRAPAQPNVQNLALNAPQYQAPQYQTPQYPAQQAQIAPSQQPNLRRGSSRPPVGRPIPPVQQAAVRPQRSTPNQRLAQFTAQSKAHASASNQVPSSAPLDGPIAVHPEQAQKSLFGRLNDNLRSPVAASADIPTAAAVPTKPVTEQSLNDVLAGGL